MIACIFMCNLFLFATWSCMRDRSAQIRVTPRTRMPGDAGNHGRCATNVLYIKTSGQLCFPNFPSRLSKIQLWQCCMFVSFKEAPSTYRIKDKHTPPILPSSLSACSPHDYKAGHTEPQRGHSSRGSALLITLLFSPMLMPSLGNSWLPTRT